jgi:sugar/nucleoside kinase (ribokinase family)
MCVLRIDEKSPFDCLVGVGGMGAGVFFALEGDHTLGRNESRAGRLLDVRDYCKLHIVIHYVAKLLGAQPSGRPFHVIPVGKVGEDAPGHFVLKEMAATGIDTRFVGMVPGRPTLFSVCFQYPDHTGGNITTNNSAADSLSNLDLDKIEQMLSAGGTRTMAVALPEVPLEARRHFLQLATRAGNFRAASFVTGEIALARSWGMFEQLDLVSLNGEEASALVGEQVSPDNPQGLIEKCQGFLRSFHPHLRMVVSAGKSGAYALSGDCCNHCPAPQVQVVSTAGAGDSLLGGILAGLAAGIPLLKPPPRTAGIVETALEIAVLLASYKVSSPHTIHPDAALPTLLEFADKAGVTFAPAIRERIRGQMFVGPSRV